TIPAATSDILLREIGVASMDEALGLMDDLARSVRALFVTLVGPVEDPAERLRTPANPSK
ncbi:MAG: hypothetical protein ABF893_17270, partial [Gluconacetobacter liquefaciens]